MRKYLLWSFILLLSINQLNAEIIKGDSLDKKALKKLLIIEGAGYTTSIILLSSLWYDKLDNSFQLFNDNKQWNGLDKIGHAYAAYHLTKANANAFQNIGMEKPKALLLSSLISSGSLMTVEVLDGFSPEYGASTGDIIANSIGAILPFQSLLFDQYYIHPKYSFHQSRYAAIRPNVLGQNFSEQWLKDYNGQTYWLSTNFNILSRNNVFPPWLAFSVGYGASEMVYGDPAENNLNGFFSRKSLYLSLDLDFSQFETDNKWLKALFYGLNMLKVPLPTLEISENGSTFHPIYF